VKKILSVVALLFCMLGMAYAQSIQQFNQNFVRGVVVLTPLATSTGTNTFTPTITPTPLNTATNTPTSTPQFTVGAGTPTLTNSPTNTPTATASTTGTSTPSSTPTQASAAAQVQYQLTAIYQERLNNIFWGAAYPSITPCTDGNGNTCTPTPTGSPTGTPSPTPTASNVFSQTFNASQNAGVTFFAPNSRTFDHFGIQVHLNAGSSAVTISDFPMLNGVHQNQTSAAVGIIPSTTTDAYFGFQLSNTNGSSVGVANSIFFQLSTAPSPTETALTVQITIGYGWTVVNFKGAPDDQVYAWINKKGIAEKVSVKLTWVDLFDWFHYNLV
jgi:hypothetical protein